MSPIHLDRISRPTAPLVNEHVSLEPLAERHRPALAAAGACPEIRALQAFNLADGFDAYFDQLMSEQTAGRRAVFAVLDSSGTVVGQTCYLDLRPDDRGVEIGATWYAPRAQGTCINPAAKLLLLDNAFAAGIVRAQLKTDILNFRSRTAILRLGAEYEGTLRKHRQRPDGSWRDTVFYSILVDDWPRLREQLMSRLERRACRSGRTMPQQP